MPQYTTDMIGEEEPTTRPISEEQATTLAIGEEGGDREEEPIPASDGTTDAPFGAF
jgi:hypothetical protein